MRGPEPGATAMLGARLAAAHDAGKVVLLDLVDERSVAEDEPVTDGGRPEQGAADQGTTDEATARAGAEAARSLEEQAGVIETRVGVPCQVMVATEGSDPARTTLDAAREANCDLVVTPYEHHHGSLSPYVKALFRGPVDVVAHRSRAGRTKWKRVVVPVRRASDVAHAMLDFATRLAGRSGRVSACTCIGPREDRRQAETMLADLVEPLDGGIETRVSRSSIETFLTETATGNDLVVMGASTDRSTASRFISRPTFERIRDLDCDVAIVDRN
jgi:nucleotide-binding universal stress UspA family protein